MHKNPLKNNRGMALILTLMVTTILITLVLELHMRSRKYVVSAASSRDQLSLYYMANSGISVAKAILIKDKKETTSDTIQEDWANESVISDILKDIPFDGGELSVKISDEMGKIQVNSLVLFPYANKQNPKQRDIWGKFLYMAIKSEDPDSDTNPLAIINSITDWIDSKDDDAITGLSGAESDYYEDLTPPYSCRNGPIPHIAELAMIKGITPAVFYTADNLIGISNFITVHGVRIRSDKKLAYNGKININTAELPVIAAMLPIEDMTLAGAIVEYRGDNSDSVFVNDISNDNWYKEAPGCSDLTINSAIITNKSDIFRIESTAKLHGLVVTIDAVILRVKEKKGKSKKDVCKVLNWYVK